MRTKTILIFAVIASLISLNNVLNSATNQQLPNRTNLRGYWYSMDTTIYHNILWSNMPTEILISYILADSVIDASSNKHIDVERFLWNVSRTSDTAGHFCKYWYLLDEYDPYRFEKFLQKAHNGKEILYDIAQWMCPYDSRRSYLSASYILHVKVNSTVHIDTANTSYPNGEGFNMWTGEYYNKLSKTLAYCQVLDTIKGKVFPDNVNARYYYGGTNNGSVGVAAQPMPNDLVFGYIDQLNRVDFDPICSDLLKFYKSLIDSLTGHWIKPQKEYIVFLKYDVVDWLAPNMYFELSPCQAVPPLSCNANRPYLTGSYGMYPVENGIVIDEANELGLGFQVPVEVFKQGIKDKINEIKNYGE